MTAITTWGIVQLERKLPDGDVYPDGTVYTAHYTVTLEQDGETASAYGSVGFSDTDPDQFTPYSELTEEEVIEWVKTALGAEQVEVIESSLAKQIEQKLNPETATGVPW